MYKSVAILFYFTYFVPGYLASQSGCGGLIYTREIMLVSIQVILSMNCLLVMYRPISLWMMPFSISLTLGSKAGQIKKCQGGLSVPGKSVAGRCPHQVSPKGHMILPQYLRTSSLRFRRAVTYSYPRYSQVSILGGIFKNPWAESLNSRSFPKVELKSWKTLDLSLP